MNYCTGSDAESQNPLPELGNTERPKGIAPPVKTERRLPCSHPPSAADVPLQVRS